MGKHEKGNNVKEMINMCDYFKENIRLNPPFEPEFKASQEINSIIEQLNQVTRPDAIKLLELANDVNNTDHYEGSGWMDYKMHLLGFLKHNGFTVSSINNELRLT